MSTRPTPASTEAHAASTYAISSTPPWSLPVTSNPYMVGPEPSPTTGRSLLSSASPVACHFNITSGTDNSRTGIGLDRPNLVSGADPYSHVKIQQKPTVGYFNKAAFTQNAVGTYGNLGRNTFRAPSNYNIDLAVSRIFPIRERLNFQLRMESFNILNHPNFSTVNATGGSALSTAFNNSAFGNYTGALDPRIFQLAGKLTF